MKGKLPDLLAAFARATERLADVLDQQEDEYLRDAAIQRFEFCFELLWKTIQAMAHREGLDVASPRGAFRAGFQLGLMDESQVWFDMLEDRNLTSHTYNERTAALVYSHLRGYLDALVAARERITARLASE